MSTVNPITGRRHPGGCVPHPAKHSSPLAMHRWYVIGLLGTALVTPVAAEKPARQQGGSRQPVQTSTASEVPAHAFDVIPGRPTGTSVTVSVLCYSDAEGCIRYGIQPGKLALKTPARLFKKGESATIELSGLKPDTCYYYQLEWAQTKSGEASFHTARPPGRAFTFTVTADSHLDDRTVPALYQQTLTNALADKPDFHIDLGDTFMTEKHANREAAPSNTSHNAITSARSASPCPCFSRSGITMEKTRAVVATMRRAPPSGPTPCASGISQIQSLTAFTVATRRHTLMPGCWKITAHGNGGMPC
jgi:hypothetical protein